ncbi:Glycinol 4-dimethylallyltransferase, partial [Mucuna pruriens]
MLHRTFGTLGSYASKASQHERKTQIEYKFLRFQQPNLNHHNKCIEGRSAQNECDGKYVVKVTSRPYFHYEPHASYPKIILDFAKKFLAAFFMFSSPYAMTTQTLSMISTSLFVVKKLSDISPLFLVGVLQAVVPHLFMGIYVAGVNQLCDLEIDKINKPYLPLASGQISFTTGVIIAASCLILVSYKFVLSIMIFFKMSFIHIEKEGLSFYSLLQSFWLGWTISSWPLIWGLLLTCLIWTAYSINVPLLRWKGHPLLATMCIFATWAIIFPISCFLHMQTIVFKRPTIFPSSLIFVVAFMSFYSVGIALCKDIPDIEGDVIFGIYSFSARLGKKRVCSSNTTSQHNWLCPPIYSLVFWICVFLFEMAFGVIFLVGATSSYLWIKIVTGLGHVVLASVLWYQAKSTNLSSKASITSFYMFIWKLLCVEYFLMPL